MQIRTADITMVNLRFGLTPVTGSVASTLTKFCCKYTLYSYIYLSSVFSRRKYSRSGVASLQTVTSQTGEMEVNHKYVVYQNLSSYLYVNSDSAML